VPKKPSKRAKSSPDRLVKNLDTRVSKETQRKVKGGLRDKYAHTLK
jgi:hypothetical protein